MTTEPTSATPAAGILIVDDMAANLEVLAEILKAEGHEPRPVLNGRQALAAAKAQAPDLILLDVRMPEMDGLEVCRRLKADPALRDIPVIFITALTEMGDKVRAFEAGAVDYVTKPFQDGEIAARVNTHLGMRALQRQLRGQNADLERIVAQRTAELEEANRRLREVDRLKDEFLRMIAHEIRTPVHGVVGIGELIIDLCPVSEDSATYAEHFRDSSLRLRNLTEDALVLAELEKLIGHPGSPVVYLGLLEEVRAGLPEVRMLGGSLGTLANVKLRGTQALLKRALEATILLARAFSINQQTVQIRAEETPAALRLCVDVDSLLLSGDQADNFFALESSARSASQAEGLGLAPVVAYRILGAFGGGLRLVKGEGRAGLVEATLAKHSG